MINNHKISSEDMVKIGCLFGRAAVDDALDRCDELTVWMWDKLESIHKAFKHISQLIDADMHLAISYIGTLEPQLKGALIVTLLLDEEELDRGLQKVEGSQI